MRFRRALALAGSATLFALAWPTASPADHVSVDASVQAILKERAASGAWRVEVSYLVRCNGARSRRCGPRQDRARVDRRDRVSGCERVTRTAR
ncbi:MAG: hypothetical protein ACXWZT_04575, partial [Gaiellaceae bacterium]